MTVARHLFVALILVFLAQLVSSRADSEAAPQTGVPPGQLKRWTISGIVDSVSGSTIIMATKFGKVEVNTTAATVVHAPPEKDVGIGAVEPGRKIVAFLSRPPVAPPSEPPGSTLPGGTLPGGTLPGPPSEFETARGTGYWKNHEDHLAAVLTLGPIDLGDSVITAAADAKAVLSNPSARDARNALRAQLLATILNLRNNADPEVLGTSIAPTVSAAIVFLSSHTGQTVRGKHQDRSEALALKDELDAYNSSGDGTLPGGTLPGGTLPSPPTPTPVVIRTATATVIIVKPSKPAPSQSRTACTVGAATLAGSGLAGDTCRGTDDGLLLLTRKKTRDGDETGKAEVAVPDEKYEGGSSPDKDDKSGGPPEKADDGGGPSDKDEKGGGPPEKADDGGGPSDKDEKGGGPPEKADDGGGPSDKDEKGGGPPEKADDGGGPSDKDEKGGGPPEKADDGGGPSDKDEKGGGPPEKADDGGGPSDKDEKGGGPPEKADKDDGPKKDRKGGGKLK